MFRNRKRRPRRLPAVEIRPAVHLEPLAALHHSPIVVRTEVRAHPWR